MLRGLECHCPGGETMLKVIRVRDFAALPGIQKVLDGMTTTEEILRVTMSD